MPNNLRTFNESFSEPFHEGMKHKNISSCPLHFAATKPSEFFTVNEFCGSSASDNCEGKVQDFMIQRTLADVKTIFGTVPDDLLDNELYNTAELHWDQAVDGTGKDRATEDAESQITISMDCYLSPSQTFLTKSYVDLEIFINGNPAEPSQFCAITGEIPDSVTRSKRDASEEMSPVYEENKVQFEHVAVIGLKGVEQGEFDEPVGVASTQQGIIAVADYNNDRLQVFSSEGNFVRAFDYYSRESGKQIAFLSPAGLAFDASGNVVVVEKGRNRLVVLSPEGTILCSFGRHGRGDGQFRGPHGVSVDGFGRIIVADTINCRVQVFDHEGSFLFAFGAKGKGKLNYPCYAIFHDGRFFVSDTDNDSVKVFDSHGTFLGKFGEEKAAFKAPSGIAVYKNKYLLVCDYSNDCVKVLSLDGTLLSKFGTTGVGPGQFLGPEAITVTPEGQIAVSDKLNSRLQIFDGAVSA